MSAKTSKAFKCEVVKRAAVGGLAFSTSLVRGGFWAQKVNALRSDPDSMLKIADGDPSSVLQLRQQARKLKVILLFARSEGFVYVRAWVPSEQQHRLVMLLREPRTLNEIRGKNLELNIEQELQSLATYGYAELRKDKWKLTEKGLSEIAAEGA